MTFLYHLLGAQAKITVKTQNGEALPLNNAVEKSSELLYYRAQNTEKY